MQEGRRIRRKRGDRGAGGKEKVWSARRAAGKGRIKDGGETSGERSGKVATKIEEWRTGKEEEGTKKKKKKRGEEKRELCG